MMSDEDPKTAEVPAEKTAKKPESAETPKETGAKTPKEIGGPEGPEPTRFGDWERNGRCFDF